MSSADAPTAERPVMEDLIQNAHTLFDEGPSQPSPVPSSNVEETMSTDTYSLLFFSSEWPESAEVQAMASTSRHRPGLVDGIPTSTRPSFSSFPSPESRFTLPPIDLNLTEGVETTTQERRMPKGAGTEAIRTSPNSTPPDVISRPAATSVTEWRLQLLRTPPHPEALRRLQSPLASESILSSTSNFLRSSATSLQTGMGSS
ncbi:hypothetical protein V8E53_002155 [Lactarius tabidus]